LKRSESNLPAATHLNLRQHCRVSLAPPALVLVAFAATMVALNQVSEGMSRQLQVGMRL